MKILCSRLKCGCLSSALLGDDDIPEEVARFYHEEMAKGKDVTWEDREYVWAERCERHEKEYADSNPDYKASLEKNP